ncbi:MAG: thioredoxin family protein [Anaerolineales bacterium]
MPANLEIYIEPNCATCELAFEIAELVQLRLPQVEVSLIDITEPNVERPDSVFAVPTYLLNGQTFSLGNPETGRLLERLESLVRAQPSS